MRVHRRSNRDQQPSRQWVALLNQLFATRLHPEGRPSTLAEVAKATGMSVPYLSLLRIGFVPTKFRLATMPTPFVLEMDTTTTPWRMRDVTAAITQEGVQAAQAHRTAERHKLDTAAWALVSALRARPPDSPMRKREAEDFLRGQGLKTRQARNLLENGYNRDVHPDGLWVLRELPGERGNPIGVKLVGSDAQEHAGEEIHVQNTSKSVLVSDETTVQKSIWDTRSTGGVQNTTNETVRVDADAMMSDFGHEAHGGCPKSAPLSTADRQGEAGGGIFRTKLHTPAGNLSPHERNLSPIESWDEEPCIHEHVNDENVCNDCGEVLDESGGAV